MKLATVCFLIQIIEYIEAIKPRSINLALKTVLEFQNNDNSANIQFIDNIQTFLSKVRKVIDVKKSRRSLDKTDYKFTDFVENLIIILKEYEDGDLEDVVAVIDDEIRKYHYKGCKFYELLENQDMRRFVARKLDHVKDESAKNIKSYLNQILNVVEIGNFNHNMKEFIDYVNSLYRQDSKGIFKKILNELQIYKSKSKRANLDLIKVVREGLRSVIFDHYSNLNANARRDFKIKLEAFWKHYFKPKKFKHNTWNAYNKAGGRFDDTNYISTTEISIFKDVRSDSGYKENTLDTVTNNAIDITTKTYNILAKLKDSFIDALYTSSGYVKGKNINENNKFIPVDVNDFPKTVNIKSKKKSIIGKHATYNVKNKLNNNNKYKIEPYLPAIENKKATREVNFVSTTLFYDRGNNKSLNIKKYYENKIAKYKTINKNEETVNIHETNDTSEHLTMTKDDNVDKSMNEDDNNSLSKKDPPHNQKKTSIKTSESKKHGNKKGVTNEHKNKHREIPLHVTLYPEKITKKTKRSKYKTTKYHRHHTARDDALKHRKEHKKEHKHKKNHLNYDKYKTENPESEEIQYKVQPKKFRESHKKKSNKHHKSHKSKKNVISTKLFEETTKKSRKYLATIKTLSSYEGISIESLPDVKEEVSLRKSNDNDTLVQSVPTTEQFTTTNIKNYSKNESNDTSVKPVTENIKNISFDVTDNEILDFWEGTTKITNSTTTTVRSQAISTTNSKSFIHRVVDNSIKLKQTQNISALPTFQISTETQAFILRASKENKTNVNFTNQESLKIKYNLTVPFVNNKFTNENQIYADTNTTAKEKTETKTTTMKKKSSTKAVKKSKTFKVANPKKLVSSPKQSTKVVPKKTSKEITTTKASETTLTVNVAHFLNKSETLNLEDERKKKMLHEKFMNDMAAVFAPTTTTAVTYTIAKDATDPFNGIDDELGL